MKERVLFSPPVLLITAVLLSALVLTALSVRNLQSQQQLLKSEMTDQALTFARGISRLFDQELARMESAFRNEGMKWLERKADSFQFSPEDLPIRFVFMLNEEYRPIRPELPWAAPPRLAIEDEKLSHDWKTRIEEAEELELSGELIKASRAYERVFADAAGAREKAVTLNCRARVYQRLGRFVEAKLAYDRIIGSFPLEVGPCGSSLGAIAAFEQGRLFAQQKQYEAAPAAYARLLRDIRAGKIRCTRDEVFFYLAMMESALADYQAADKINPADVAEYQKQADFFRMFKEIEQWALRLKAEGRLMGLAEGRFEYIPVDHEICLAAGRILEQPAISLAALIDLQRLRENVRSLIEKIPVYSETLRFEITTDYHEPFIASREPPLDENAVRVQLSTRLPEWQVSAKLPESDAMRRNVRMRAGFNIGILVLLLLMIGAGSVGLARLTRKERDLARMKTDFVSRVSHEMRTPLTGIRMIGEMLLCGKVRDAERSRDYLGILENETERLTRLINKMLDFSRMDSGRRPYEFKVQSLAPIVSQAARAFQATAISRNQRLQLNVTPNLPEIALDADAMTEVVFNLLDNAAKYSPDNTTISIRLDRREDRLCLTITDEGIGMEPAQQMRIFEKFYRADNETVQQAQGTGVGLAIVKHIVNAHGGNVEVKSRPGAGSSFVVSVPVAKEHRA